MGDIVEILRSVPNSTAEKAADEIERLHAQLAEAHLRGVKAGLEAAKVAIAEGLIAERDEVVFHGWARAEKAVRAIDPASIKPDDTGEGGADVV